MHTAVFLCEIEKGTVDCHNINRIDRKVCSYKQVVKILQ